MGARNSIPQTAEIINPTNAYTNFVTITEDVSHRVQDVRNKIELENQPKENKEKPFVCEKCANEKNAKAIASPKQALNTPVSRNQEIENHHFDEAYKKIDSTLKKPMNWAEEHKLELQALESDLLKCYQEYNGEPLQCHRNAKDYQKFVFEKQYKAILKHTEAVGGGADGDRAELSTK